MGFVRKSLLVVITPLFVLLLCTVALDFGILHVAGSPAPVKQLLADSGIYNSVVSSALDQAQSSTDASSNKVSLADPAIKSAAESTFTPDVVQHTSEQVIDGIYNWLNGKVNQPDFSIDLTSVKATFAVKVGQAAKAHAAALPVCTAAPTTTDPLSITCLPPGVTPAQVGQQATSDVLSAQGFLDHPVITAENVKKSGTNQPVFTTGKLQDAPKQFQRAKKTPLILVLLTLLAAVAIIFLSTSRRKGFKRVGAALIITGAIMLGFAWGFNTVVNHKIIPKVRLDNKVLQVDVQKLSTDLAKNIDQNYWIFGGTYVALGLLAVGGAMFIARGKDKDTPPSAPVKSSSGSSTPAKSSVKAPQTQQPKRTPPKVQG